jgi:cell filamentation protein
MRNRNAYQYIDHDYSYTDPKTGVLRNLLDCADRDGLVFLENNAAGKRAKELLAKPLPIKDSSSLFDIHRYLFQDIYRWAGERRTVEISKSGKQFFPTNHFDTALIFLDNLIADYRLIPGSDKHAVAAKLAYILDTINELHPFREGNGRTQREFVRVLAQEKGYVLNLNPPDDRDVYERYMSGTIDGDVEKLTLLIEERME